VEHDIIYNQERKLAASIKPLLSEAEGAKFAVGYFFISGFKLVADELEKPTELRLFIGNVSDSQTIEQLAETHSAAGLLAQTRKREFFLAAAVNHAVGQVGQPLTLHRTYLTGLY
jgi:hypothetical protein